MSAERTSTIEFMQPIIVYLLSLVIAGAIQFATWGLIIRIQRRGDWTAVRQMFVLLAVVAPILVFLVWLIQLGILGLRGQGPTAEDWFLLIAMPLWACAVALLSVWSLAWWTRKPPG
jgi:hypothetical protein